MWQVTGHDQGRSGKDQRWFSATCIRGNEITVKTLSLDPHEAGGRCGDANKNYPDGRERLSGIDDRVCAVNRGGGNLTAASSSVRRAVTSYVDIIVLLAHSNIHPSRPDTMALRRQKHRQQRWRDWRCFRYITTHSRVRVAHLSTIRCFKTLHAVDKSITQGPGPITLSFNHSLLQTATDV
jgi:hypothetical protein